MFSSIYMIMVFDPQILFNDGFHDLLDVRIHRGSLLKPSVPTPLSCRTGLVSAGGAWRHGVVLTPSGSVDAAANEARRAAMRSSRGELPPFDRGDDIETLRANCMAATGLPPPRAPVRSAPVAHGVGISAGSAA